MKSILIFFTCLFGFHSFAQQPNTGMLYSLNAWGLEPNWKGSDNSPIQPFSILSILAYDSVRAITELNNPNQADAFPCLSVDGLRLYYTGGSFGQLMMATRPSINSFFGPPVVIPLLQYAWSYWLSYDELDLYACPNNTVKFAHRNSTVDPFGPFTSISIGMSTNSIRNASLDSSQNRMTLSMYGNPYDGIYEFTRIAPDSFTLIRSIAIPNGYYTNSGKMSRDGLHIFVDALTGSNPFKIYQMSRNSLLDTFDIATFQEVAGINDTLINNIQASVSADWLAFVRSIGSWQEDDLYIASATGVLTNVFDPEERPVSIYPNPAGNFFKLNGILPESQINIRSIDGREIRYTRQQQGKIALIQVDHAPPGLYTLLVKSDHNKLKCYKLLLGF